MYIMVIQQIFLGLNSMIIKIQLAHLILVSIRTLFYKKIYHIPVYNDPILTSMNEKSY